MGMLKAGLRSMAESGDRFDALDKVVRSLVEGLASVTSAVADIRSDVAQTRQASLEARGVLAEQLPVLIGNILGLSSRLDESSRSLKRQLSGSGVSSVASTHLYLDLIEVALTGALGNDGSLQQGQVVAQNPIFRSIGFDWPASALTMIGHARMRNLRMLTERALTEGVPGDLIETGIWRGGACIYMSAILAAYGDKERRVFCADSFKGLPEPDAAYPADEGDPHSTFEELRVTAEQVRENFERYGLLSDQVVFLEGWFKDTLPTAPIEKLAVLRLDGDMYESTIQALDALYHKVSPGGFVVVDDYILRPCAKAVDDFRAANKIVAPMIPVDSAAVWWQVPK